MKRTRTVSISPRVLAALEHEARSTGQDVSACVERAWAAARSRLSALPPPAPLPQNWEDAPEIPDPDYVDREAEAIFDARFAGAAPAPVTLTLAADLLEDMIDHSFRLARSLGWLIERAWCLALVVPPAAWSPPCVDTQPMPRVD